VTHPHGLAAALRPDAVEHRALVGHLDQRAAELADGAGLDPAAELLHHRLLAVADAQHRHPRRQQRRVGARRVRLDDRRRAAGEDYGARREPGEERRIDLGAWVDLAVDAGLAHPPGDQLRHLAAEINDENAVGHRNRSSALRRRSQP
jgi:hypothetical protein